MKIVGLLLILCLTSCQTSSGATEEDLPPIPWSDISAVPEAAEGSVVPLPAEAATEEERLAMDLLGIPHDGYVLSPEKLEAAANLRLFTEQLHANAVANTGLGKVWTAEMWRQLTRADKALDAELARQNSWWGRNGDTVIFGSGFTLGAAITVLIAYGLNQALADQ